MATAAMEGLYARLYISTTNPPVLGSVVALLQGLTFSGRQTNRGWFAMGSLIPDQYLRGIIEFDVGFRKGYIDSKFLGTFHIGTYIWYGSLCPRGPNVPAILGSVIFEGVDFSNMEAENEAAVLDEYSCKMYNLTFDDA